MEVAAETVAGTPTSVVTALAKAGLETALETAAASAVGEAKGPTTSKVAVAPNERRRRDEATGTVIAKFRTVKSVAMV